MTVARPANELDAEREIDLGRWRVAIVRRWWMVAAGLVAGAVIGGLVSVGRGSVWQASVLLSPAQAFSPSGAPVLNYNSSPRGINDLVTSEATLAQVGADTNVSVARLRNNVTTQSISTGAANTATRGAVLIKITAQLNSEKAAADVANALGSVVVKETSSPYVEKSIGVLTTSIANNKKAEASLEALRIQLNATIPKTTDQFERLFLLEQAQNISVREQTITNNLALQQQELALTNSVERAQIIGPPAKAVKTTAVSRRNALLVGALIGLLIGAVVAIVADPRLPQPRV